MCLSHIVPIVREDFREETGQDGKITDGEDVNVDYMP